MANTDSTKDSSHGATTFIHGGTIQVFGMVYRVGKMVPLGLLLVVWTVSDIFVAGKTRSSPQCEGILRTTVVEGLPPGRTIFKFTYPLNVVYRFNEDLPSSSALAIFQISSEGAVSNLVTLDREDHRGSSFTLTVLTKKDNSRDIEKSQKGWTTACTLKIKILDVNDNDPTFGNDLYAGAVLENAAIGTVVGGLQGIYATDADEASFTVERYKILHGNGADAFEAVTNTIGGLKFLSIRTRKPLDREDVSFYVLTVQAMDGGKPSRTGNTQIRINVLDVNDRSPKFSPSEYSMSILSSTPTTTSVFKVHAEDDDLGVNGEIYYYFKTPQNLFTLDPHTGVIRVARALDFTLGNTFDLSVVAQDRGNSPRQTQTAVTVSLVKSNMVNMASPKPTGRVRFAKQSYYKRIREDLPVGSHILHANVLHLTRSTFYAPMFKVLSDEVVPFEVDTISGFLYLGKRLDYEARRVYHFRLEVADKNSDVNDKVNVTIQVDDVDENFHKPVFEKANLEANLRRSTKHLQLIQELKASDRDQGVSGLVKYYIRGGNGVGKFIIDENLGKLYSKSGINWAGINQLELLVEARDCARWWKSSKQFVVINVIGPEDCKPMFTMALYRVSLRENLPRRTFVVDTHAEDCEKGSKLTYSITSENMKRRFEIEKETGIIRTTKMLDREDQDVYILEVTARGQTSSIAQVFIRVTDVNDNGPIFVFPYYKVHLTENRGKVDNLLCLQAKDKDLGENGEVHYEIIAGNEKKLFTVHPITGTLTSDSSLNYEIKKEHTLRIRATDQGSHARSSDTTVSISVTDINDPPKFIADDITVVVLEEKPPGSTVTFLSVTDEDEGENGKFVCSYENIDAEEFGKFAVKTTSKGCEIRNVHILDWFGKNAYSLLVRVTDKASPKIRKSDVIRVTVEVKDINNHAPEFSQESYWSSTPEDTPLFTSTILKVNATDKDRGRNAQIQYSITNATSLFKIDASDGSITAKRKLSVRKHKLVVYAEDNGNPSRRTEVMCFITVYPKRAAPEPLPRVSIKRIPEDADINTGVAIVRIRAGRNKVKCKIVGGNNGGAFKMRNSRVLVASSLDYERVKEYELIIRAFYKPYKCPELAIEVPVKVHILDVNDNKPSFRIENHPLVININKPLTSGAFVTRVLAFDADSGANGRVTYRLKESSDPVYFSIKPESGKITATKSIDSRDAPYTFTVVAEDDGRPRQRSEYDVQVKVYKDTKSLRFPQEQWVGNISEGPSGLYTKVLTLGIDHGSENDLVYSIVKGNLDHAFCIDINGSLYSAGELDRETISSYNLTVSVTDRESSATADLSITVDDINDNLPQFSSEPIRVSTRENAQRQVIGKVKAEDMDSGGNAKIRYEIVSVSSTSYHDKFTIDQGILIITGSLDHELAPEHILTIAAQDQGSPSHRTFGRVIISVKDENDNSPRFLSHSFSERVPFNAPKGFPIFRTLATDDDIGLNGEIRYAIEPALKEFSIDETTGYIIVNSGLSHRTFLFNVSATDNGTPRKRDTAFVAITVEVGEGHPRFDLAGFPRGFHANIREDQGTGNDVLNVSAVSKGLVTYGIYDDDIKDFQIDAISGRITIARSLDFERKQQYDFTVSATDLNDRMSLAHVTISIVNVNDNRPHILNRENRNKEIACRITRDAPVETHLIQIRAHDNDKHDRLLFSLSEVANHAYFSIDSDGNIRTKSSLPKIDHKIYIGVTVMDNGYPQLEDSVTVNVIILNYIYSYRQSSIRADVSEGTPPNTPLTLSKTISPRDEQTRFSIVYPPESPFSIHQIKGTLILKESLDYEEQSKYSLTVRLREKNDYHDIDVDVFVKDENDNRPEFRTPPNSKVRIDVNARPDTLIHQFQATDKDSGSNREVAFRVKEKYPGFFSLNETTGKLTTTGAKLDKAVYNLTVTAYDKGTPMKSSRTFIIVDVNDWKPEFTMEEYKFEVNEDAQVGYYIGVIKARSFGRPLDFTATEENHKFSVNPKNGVLTLLSPVDYEKSEQRSYELSVVAKSQLFTSSVRITIHVRDVNDCAPKFFMPTYVDHVPESVPIGTTVLRINAIDDDSGLNAAVRYSLDNEDFIIDSYSGLVTTAAALDYERKSLYRINVMAHDRGTPSLNGTTQLLVFVSNVNDNAPVFTSEEYSCGLWENAKKGSRVTTVKSTDADKDSITYYITGGNEAGTFVINPVSGVIKISEQRSVDVVGPFYYLNVTASDGVHRGHARVRVNIKDINDHAPVFPHCDQYFPTITENAPVGTYVLKVSATDDDLGDNGQIEYAIVQPNARLFQIDQKTGLIETAVTFDRERRRKYPIGVKAIDGNSGMRAEERLEGSCFIEATIKDVNDNKPVFDFSSYRTNIKENVGIGHHVLRVKALDQDEGINAVVSYTLQTPSSLFRIDNQTGLITTKADLMNKKNKYKLRIMARDHGEPRLSAEVDLSIDVIDSDNDPPQFIQSFYDAVIPENTSIGSTVGHRMVATSKNSKHNVFYSMIPGNVPATNNPKRFNIDPFKGIVRVQRTLDREFTPNYTLTIQAVNDANPPLSSSTILRILLTDINDCAPEFPLSHYKATIPENSEPGTSVLTVTAIDRDIGINSKTAYGILNRNKEFRINSQTGLISSRKKFDREKKASYTFVVKATDKKKPTLSSSVIVYVTVEDVNDLPPRFSSNYTAKIGETVPIGTEVTTVSASDGDLGLNARVKFDIKSGNEDDKFRIHPDGRVVVNDGLDYEKRRKYELILHAWDGKHEDTAQLTIAIVNENDNNPIFQTKSGTQEAWVQEGSPKGTTVTNLTATDPDLEWHESRKRIKYQLSSLTKIFRIDPNTGAIRTEAVLDREAKDTYTFQAYASDGEGRTGSVQVVVHVTDVNDNAPEFLKDSITGVVLENELPGTMVKKIVAIDKDQGNNGVVRYGLRASNNTFTIDASSGVLKTNVTLDREVKDTYKLIVYATDGGKKTLSSRTEVVIKVLDDNDHAPEFVRKNYQENIPENKTVGSSVLKLSATDGDEGPNARLRYSILKGNVDGAFRVILQTGEVVVASPLDYEDKKKYEFEVKVEDAGLTPMFDTAKVIINLQDSNDRSPRFIRSRYRKTLSEGNYNQTKILTLLAEDSDATAINKAFRYSIFNGSGTNFLVDPNSGELFVTSSLDYELSALHVLSVRATNTAPPHGYDEAVVVIEVTDVNDNAPELTNSSRNQEIFENLPKGRRTIFKLQATDRDLDPNGKQFTFGIRGKNEQNLFKLNRNTGELTTEETFDREHQAVYSLDIWVRDSGNPPLTNNVTVKIHVRDRNDNQHKPGLLELTVNFLEQQTISPNTPLGKVFVDDKDTDDLRLYEMITGDFNIFSIDQHTGNIYMKQKPASKEYTFRVKVSDRNSTFSPVKCEVRINVNTMPEDAFLKSVALRFLKKTRTDFVKNLTEHKKLIAEAINTRPENVDLFSVQSAGKGSRAVDVRFGAHGSPYYEPESLIATLKANRYRFTARGLNVVIGYDACASERCKNQGCKSEVNLTGGIDTVDDGNGKSFASVVTRTGPKCGKCEDLFSNSRSCLNSGKRKEMPNAHLCTCPRQYQGPNCELTTRSFKKREWIWLRPLRSCVTGNLSLEFSTLRANGPLLYNGPMFEMGPGDNYDFILVQLHEGKVHVEFSLGDQKATVLTISKSAKLNDGEWHLVEIFHNATLVRVVIDQCKSSLVKTSATMDVEDRSNCENSSVIRDTKFNVWNMNGPLQIGGVYSSPPEYINLRTLSYEGCIRNVKENGKMFDLKAVSKAKGSQEGCHPIDRHCLPTSPCYGEAKCAPSRYRSRCICPPGYQGTRCDAKSVEQTFAPPGFIIYRMNKSFLKTYNPKFTKIEMMIRTRDKNGGVLLSVRDKEGLERLTLRIVNKRKKLSLEGKVRREDDEHIVQLPNTFLGDGQWHHVTMTRNRNKMHLGIDVHTNPRTASGKSSGKFMLLNIDKYSDIFVGSMGLQTNVEEDFFDGCIKDIRLNGKVLPHNTSNDIAMVTKSAGVTQECRSAACKTTRCPDRFFCHDVWRKSKCLLRACNKRRCRNNATCEDHAVDGKPIFKCLCPPGFNGTLCEHGATVITRMGREGTINLKLVIGLSCFVFVLALATFLIVFYHRHQNRVKGNSDAKIFKKKGDKKTKKPGKKDIVIIERLDLDNNSKTHDLITNAYPSMYSSRSLNHTCEAGQPPTVPRRSDSLQTNRSGRSELTHIPEWDIPPLIDVVLSPDSDDSQIYDDFIDCPEEQPGESSQIERPPTYPPGNSKLPAVTWNDIEEYGRKFYTMTKNFLGRDDDTRPSSSVSTTSNSSSVVTVVENPRA